MEVNNENEANYHFTDFSVRVLKHSITFKIGNNEIYVPSNFDNILPKNLFDTVVIKNVFFKFHFDNEIHSRDVFLTIAFIFNIKSIYKLKK